MRVSLVTERLLTLVPYFYMAHTRAPRLRDHLANAATGWVPGFLMLWLMTDLGTVGALAWYAIGYAAFICLYEIGYLMNDTLGLRHDVVARDRLGFKVGPSYVAAFAIIRATVFAAVLMGAGLLWSSAYLIACGALASVTIAHNTLRRVELKFTSFLQMSVLRFFLPVYPGLLAAEPAGAAVVLITGVFFFSYPRLLTYQEAKDRLFMPERREPFFHFQSMLMTFPIAVAISAVSGEVAPLAVWLWLCFVGLVASRIQRSASHP